MNNTHNTCAYQFNHLKQHQLHLHTSYCATTCWMLVCSCIHAGVHWYTIKVICWCQAPQPMMPSPESQNQRTPCWHRRMTLTWHITHTRTYHLQTHWSYCSTQHCVYILRYPTSNTPMAFELASAFHLWKNTHLLTISLYMANLSTAWCNHISGTCISNHSVHTHRSLPHLMSYPVIHGPQGLANTMPTCSQLTSQHTQACSHTHRCSGAHLIVEAWAALLQCQLQA